MENRNTGIHNRKSRQRGALLVIWLLLAPTATVPLLGCFVRGGLLADGEFVYRHPSVKWIYRAGHQIAVKGPLLGIPIGLPVARDHWIGRLSKGNGCATFSESPNASCGEVTWYWPGFDVALDLESGAAVAMRDVRDDQMYPRQVWDEVRQKWANERGYQLLLSQPDGVYLLGQADEEVRIFELHRSPQWERGDTWRVYNRGSDMRIVFRVSDRYIVCVDLDEIPELAPPRFRSGGGGLPTDGFPGRRLR